MGVFTEWDVMWEWCTGMVVWRGGCDFVTSFAVVYVSPMKTVGLRRCVVSISPVRGWHIWWLKCGGEQWKWVELD